MSAVGPEFYKYIKKLEENGDKLPSVSPQQRQPIDFEFNNSTCYQCNGYYGPSFGEPVCVTCHAFLFPDFPSYLPKSYFYNDKTDDGDSGNDEPSDLNYGSDQKVTKFIPIPAWFYYTKTSADSETSPEDEASHASNSGPGASSSNGGSSDWVSGEFLDLRAPRPPPNVVRSLQALTGVRAPPPPPNVAGSLQALSTPRPPDNLAPGLVEQLPSEVLLCIFSYLDDMSLCACAVVCARWWRLVRARMPPARWAAFTARRWPLFRPMLDNYDWHKMLRNDPPEGIAATPLDLKCCHWQAMVMGPVGSPYEGGVFYLYIQVPYSYPMSPPVVRFLTRILHPNVSRHGDVGIDSVHHNWSLALTLSKVLISIQSLLTDPYTAVCMEPAIGAMYVHERARFEALARRWTWRYAMQELFY